MCSSEIKKAIVILVVGLREAQINLRFNPLWILNRKPKWMFTLNAFCGTGNGVAYSEVELLHVFSSCYLHLALNLLTGESTDNCQKD